jgi:hypothetical protein
MFVASLTFFNTALLVLIWQYLIALICIRIRENILQLVIKIFRSIIIPECCLDRCSVMFGDFYQISNFLHLSVLNN